MQFGDDAVYQLGYVPTEWLRALTTSAAILLFVSLVVSLWSNWRYHRLSATSRDRWRNRLYAFVDQPEWHDLVSDPIRKSLRVYVTVSMVITILYVALIAYLLHVGEWVSLSKIFSL